MNNQEIESCLNDMRNCVTGMRLGRNIEAGDIFVKVLDCIQTRLEQVPSINSRPVQSMLAEMMECQAAHNNIRLADILEYELAPLIFPE